jgi:hypothetical protein
MLYGIQIQAHGWPRNRSHGFTLEVGGYCYTRQLEAALHREWQQLSQQDIRRITGGMRRRVEADVQARGGYTRYRTLNNTCRQVIHM